MTGAQLDNTLSTQPATNSHELETCFEVVLRSEEGLPEKGRVARRKIAWNEVERKSFSGINYADGEEGGLVITRRHFGVPSECEMTRSGRANKFARRTITSG